MRNADHFFATARERYRIKLARESGQEQPWTTDPVFREWFFCNVHREDDRTTRWLRDNIREQPLTNLRMVEAVLIFRWFNRIESGEAIKSLLLGRWQPDLAHERLSELDTIFTGAYIIRAEFGRPKLDGIIWAIEEARPKLPAMVSEWGTSLQQAWDDLRSLMYMGSFMAYEVVTDLRWTPVLAGAHDINTWAAAGPGCARGLGRVVQDKVDLYNYASRIDQATMLELMRDLLAQSRSKLVWPKEWTPWEMREVEHWLCEYDKYCRAVEGWRLKRRYKGVSGGA